MQLEHIHIHNFRCIRDAEFQLEPFSLLVGANNAGKSTVIDCIRAVYEKDKYKFIEKRDLPVGDLEDQDSWTELTFRLTPDEHGGLAEKYRTPEQSLRLRKWFKSTSNPALSGSLFGYLSTGEVDESPFYGAKGVQNGKIGDIIYVPAVSTVEEQTKLTGPSALRDLLTDLLGSVVEGSQSYQSFSREFETFVEDIKTAQTANDQSLSDFEHELDSMLSKWNVGFEIQFQPPSVQEIVKSMLGWGLLDEITNRNFDHKCFGSGFQRHFIYSLISVGAKFAKQAPTKKAKDFTPSMRLLLFEEPEVFLHPPQQENMARDLAQLTEQEGWQVLCSTHSPHFVSRQAERISTLVRLRSIRGISKAYQVSNDNWNQLLAARAEIEAILPSRGNLSDDEKSRLEALRYFLWLNPEKCGLFFSEQVLLVEGITEVGFFNRLLADGRIVIAPSSCYVLSCEGKFNLHRFIRLLSHLGIPHVVVFDDDQRSTETYHPQLNRLVRDSASEEFTRSIVEIPENLEAYLEMPVPERRLKPLLALHRYESSQFNESRLSELCHRIESGFAPR